VVFNTVLTAVETHCRLHTQFPAKRRLHMKTLHVDSAGVVKSFVQSTIDHVLLYCTAATLYVC